LDIDIQIRHHAQDLPSTSGQSDQKMHPSRADQTEAQRIEALEGWKVSDIDPWKNELVDWKAGVDKHEDEVDDWKGRADRLQEKADGWQRSTDKWKVGVNTWQAQTERWKVKHNDILDGLPGFEKDVKNSLHSLTTSDRDHSMQLHGFDQFANTISPRVTNLERWKGDTDSNLESLFKNTLSVSSYKTATEELEEWKKGADTKFDSIFKNTVNAQVYNENKNKLTNELKAMSGKTDALTEMYAVSIRPMQNRLNDLEGRSKSLEMRFTDHDCKITGFEKEFGDVRQEIKVSHTQLGDQIIGHNNKVDKSFRKLENMLAKIDVHGWNGLQSLPEKSQTKSPTNGSGDSGSDGESRIGVDSRNQASKSSPGGINVSNFGEMSLQHAPTCIRFNDSFNSSNSIYCSCMTQYQTLFPGLGGRCLRGLVGWGGLRSGPVPCPCYERPSESQYRRRYCDSGESSSIYNHTPSFRLSLGRTSGGGLFSKPKHEDMSIELGSGSGRAESGRSKRREKDSDWKRS
jgi:hypothetical protein